MNKIFFLALAFLVFCCSFKTESRPLTKRDIRFDIHKMKNSLQPTVLRMADELCILIGSLYKRRELDEVNQRSLMRIRGYLAHIYHRGDISEKQKKRVYMAIRQITAELENRVAFEKRYAEGLVETNPPLRSSRSDGASAGTTARRTVSEPSLRHSHKAVQETQRPRSGHSQMGSAYGVRESWGRRLYNLIQAGLLEEASLDEEDLSVLNAYRQSPNFKKDQETASRPRGRAVARRAGSSAPPAPRLSAPAASRLQGHEASTRGGSATSAAPPRLSAPAASSAPIREAGRQPLRTDNILRSVEQQIDQRIQSGQLDPNRRDPRDYRDQIQGASDEEWAAS